MFTLFNIDFINIQILPGSINYDMSSVHKKEKNKFEQNIIVFLLQKLQIHLEEELHWLKNSFLCSRRSECERIVWITRIFSFHFWKKPVRLYCVAAGPNVDRSFISGCGQKVHSNPPKFISICPRKVFSILEAFFPSWMDGLKKNPAPLCYVDRWAFPLIFQDETSPRAA